MAASRGKRKTGEQVLLEIFDMSDDDFEDGDSSDRDSDYRPSTPETDDDKEDRLTVITQSVQAHVDTENDLETDSSNEPLASLRTDGWIPVGDTVLQ